MVLIIGNGCLEIRMSWDSVCDYDWINAPIILCVSITIQYLSKLLLDTV